MRKRIVRELQIMHGCHSDYIVTFYGAFLNDNNDVIMCMEYMDVGYVPPCSSPIELALIAFPSSLDSVSRAFGPIRVDVLGKIAEATLGGLTYLYTKHHIMHRDIKPSNILVNSKGGIKLCDFGVSGELINSMADTFVGTSTYMAPERIQGDRYTVKSDVWSYGLSIMELAIGRFPFSSNEEIEDGDCAPAGILDLLQQIVYEPAPKLPKSDAFPPILEDMIHACLAKNPDDRPTPQELFVSILPLYFFMWPLLTRRRTKTPSSRRRSAPPSTSRPGPSASWSATTASHTSPRSPPPRRRTSSAPPTRRQSGIISRPRRRATFLLGAPESPRRATSTITRERRQRPCIRPARVIRSNCRSGTRHRCGTGRRRKGAGGRGMGLRRDTGITLRTRKGRMISIASGREGGLGSGGCGKGVVVGARRRRGRGRQGDRGKGGERRKRLG